MILAVQAYLRTGKLQLLGISFTLCPVKYSTTRETLEKLFTTTGSLAEHMHVMFQG